VKACVIREHDDVPEGRVGEHVFSIPSPADDLWLLEGGGACVADSGGSGGEDVHRTVLFAADDRHEQLGSDGYGASVEVGATKLEDPFPDAVPWTRGGEGLEELRNSFGEFGQAKFLNRRNREDSASAGNGGPNNLVYRSW